MIIRVTESGSILEFKLAKEKPAPHHRQDAAIMEEVDRELGPNWVDAVRSSAVASIEPSNPQPFRLIRLRSH